MKNTQAAAQRQPSFPKPWPGSTETSEQFTGQSKGSILISLMIPYIMVILNLSMFGIALPTLRDTFALQADVVAWLVTAYMLPFMISMPLYGRLGDELGKRRLFIVGIVTFLIGTVVTSLGTSFSLLIVGRMIQGIGGASVVPLSMAIISQNFPANERGKALGTWNSIGPITGIVAPFAAGLLIDHVGWRMIFGPILLAGVIAAWVVHTQIPVRKGKMQLTMLRRFDWTGVLLLGAAMTSLLFYLSSPSITGVAALQDWRLLLVTILLFTIFIAWEKRQLLPYLALNVLANKTFCRASITAGTRMFNLGGMAFLVPLYLTDIYHLSAASIGTLLTLHSAALLVTMRVGGQLADRWNSRAPVVAGFITQSIIMIIFAFLPESTPLWGIAFGIIINSLGAGLSLAALHRASLGQIPSEQAGLAAGLYSLIRFTGTALGPALAGVVLQQGLDRSLLAIEAYQLVFWLIAGVAFMGLLSAVGIREETNA